jgi:prepilin-type N-terminal cleavage/methylation domain-containing protein
MKKKGFTLVELLVVIAIIALLMSILMPALAMVKEMANRVVCGSNCGGLVKAMIIYSNDTESGRFPRTGTPTTTWGVLDTAAWKTATVSSSLFLLVRFQYVGPKSFICKSDPLASEMKGVVDFTTVWDFKEPAPNASYAYQIPYTAYGSMSSSSEPGLVVLADRNPYVLPTATPPVYGNSKNHGSDGQEIAKVDASVSWSKVPYCGVDNDNIYTYGVSRPAIGTTAEMTGTLVTVPMNVPVTTDRDSVVVNQK